MKLFYLLLISICVFLQPAYALVRAPKPHSAPCGTHHPAEKEMGRSGHVLARLPHLRLPRFRGPRQNPYDRFNSTTEGMISFVCAMLALVCLAAVGITSFQLLLIPVFLFATIAAIAGAIGVKRLKSGYAIVGLVVGLLAIVGGFMTLALMEL